jgi:hypothetical protein
VCRFHVAAGAKLRPGQGAIHTLSRAVAKLASINLRKLVLSPTFSINLGFILREDLLLCSSHLLLGFPTGRSSTKLLHQHRTINKFSGAVVRDKEDFCKGSLSLTIFYFVIVLLYFIFACIFLSKIQKEFISSFDSLHYVTFTFSLLCCSLSMLWRTLQ